MGRFIQIAFFVCVCASLAMAQFGPYGYDFSDGYLTSFGAPSYSSGLSSVAQRDPRANTGPVLFPPSPPGDPSQTSGVVVGASGYGFVPPGSSAPGIPRFFYQGFYLR